MGLDPTTAPFVHRAVGRAKGGGELLITLVGMRTRSGNDPSTQSQRLRSCLGTNKLFKFFGFCICQAKMSV
jgi:hypothetical protein